MIFAIWALTRDTAPSEPPPGENGIYQNGSEPLLPEPSPESTPDTSLTSPDTSLAGPVAFDFENGTMTFLFTPNQQDVIDNNTDIKLGELLTSPKNTNDAKIAVEIPQLPDAETAILTTAILNVFNKHGVPLSEIVFFVYEPEPDIKTYEINISFS